MKSRSIITFTFCLMHTWISVQAQNSIEIEATNLKNSKGSVAVELVDKNNETVRGGKYEIKQRRCKIVFQNLASGHYAIRYFHDENSNDKVDKILIGIPREGVGFSNNAIGKFGPKKFEKLLFPVHGDTKIKIKTFYW